MPDLRWHRHRHLRRHPGRGSGRWRGRAGRDRRRNRPGWAGDALDQVRRDTWNAARYALGKNPENLTDRQDAWLTWTWKVNPQPYRAYLLKEQLRRVSELKGDEGKALLESWVGWARRCRIPSFVELGRRITRHRAAIEETWEHRLSAGLVESTNTKLRLPTRIAFGCKSPEAMIALAMLNLGGYRPPLPGRHTA